MFNALKNHLDNCLGHQTIAFSIAIVFRHSDYDNFCVRMTFTFFKVILYVNILIHYHLAMLTVSAPVEVSHYLLTLAVAA